MTFKVKSATFFSWFTAADYPCCCGAKRALRPGQQQQDVCRAKNQSVRDTKKSSSRSSLYEKITYCCAFLFGRFAINILRGYNRHYYKLSEDLHTAIFKRQVTLWTKKVQWKIEDFLLHCAWCSVCLFLCKWLRFIEPHRGRCSFCARPKCLACSEKRGHTHCTAWE